MDSFINMLGSEDWSDADIKSRTEAVIAAEFPPVEFAILSRKLQGQAFGYVLTADEQSQLARYQALAFQAGALADQARKDMAQLRQAWAVEAAQRAIAELPEDADKAGLQATIDGAAPDVLALVQRRQGGRGPSTNYRR